MRNFVISGFGRSGTKFLARTMNMSDSWTVHHEPGPSRYRIPATEVQHRFDRDKYGEVNSLLRHAIFDLRVEKKGIILRNPLDIMLSVANKKRSISMSKLRQIDEGLGLIDKAVEEGMYVIRFEKMTTEVTNYLSILHHFGINDMDHLVTPALLSRKFNYKKTKKYHNFEDLPDHAKQMAEKYNWFIEKYYG